MRSVDTLSSTENGFPAGDVLHWPISQSNQGSDWLIFHIIRNDGCYRHLALNLVLV